MKRIAIIGGGVSGLNAAYAVQKQLNKAAELDYVLFEAGPRFGGVIRTERVGDFLIEAGPDSFLTEKPWAAELCRELGLGDQLIASNDSERRTYILIGARLVPLPDGLMFMVPTDLSATFLSPLFSWQTKLRMIREWFRSPSPDFSESTVAEFVERHYGREMVDRVADPMLAGIYGGGADELSASSVLARFVEIEAKQGSLGKSMVAARQLQTTPARPLFTTLKNGMQTMTDAMLAQIPESARRMNTPIEALRPESGKWLVVGSGRTEEFDAVIVATPAHPAAELLRDYVPEVSSELNQIRYSSSVTATLAYDEKTRVSLPPGFGFLVPRTENQRILAGTFVHNKFPNRAPADSALIRCFLGGTRDEEVLQSPDIEIIAMVRRELEEILGITAEPMFAKIYKWPKAMAQYSVGHKTRVERIRKLMSATPGLALAGNGYSGIGVPDCVRSGSEAATKVLIDLAILPLRAQASR